MAQYIMLEICGQVKHIITISLIPVEQGMSGGIAEIIYVIGIYLEHIHCIGQQQCGNTQRVYMPTSPIPDPPHIMNIHSFTLYSEPHGVESAVLECEVENREADLKVWVNWATRAETVVGQKGCISGAEEHILVCLLVLHNVTTKDVRPYICQLFSAYSPTKAEDDRTAEILIAG